MKRWTLDREPSSEQLDEIAATLTAGGVVLMPTDTIYGLHAVAGSRAVERIVEIKGRDENKPFVTIASSFAAAAKLVTRIPPELDAIWPAPLTAILPRGDQTIAVRVPAIEWLRALLERTGPLVSTSANRSGEPSITFPGELARDVIDKLDGIVDGGRIDGKASTIVDFTGEPPRVLREGDPGFTQFLWKTLRKSL